MTLPDLLDPDAVHNRLTEAGLPAEAARSHAARLADAARSLLRDGVGTDRPARAFFVPGRIEVLGKHTDYAGGSSLVCAVPQGFTLVAVPEAGPHLRLTETTTGESVAFSLAPDLLPRAGHWANYPMTVARRVAVNFGPALRGGRLAFSGDLPRAAGMSSSSAFVVAVFLALSAMNDLEKHPAFVENIPDRMALTQYLGSMENGRPFGALPGDRGVGTFGGSEDHTAILCSKAGTLRHFAYAPVRLLHTAPMPEGHVFAVGVSGVVAEKAGAARARYNRAALLAAEAASAWRSATGDDAPHLGAILERPGFRPERMRRILAAHDAHDFPPEDLIARFEHFLEEHGRLLPAAVEALGSGDLAAFGRLVDASQAGAEPLLGNQIPETVFLARSARELGAAAASAFGAGFGGSVWALVPERDAEAFLARWRERYRHAFPDHASGFFLTRPGPAAFEL
ncbi:galactokinase family protein [Rhodocaloribacter sp.]